MQLVAAKETDTNAFADYIPELVWATGPVSYDYHFADRALFDAVVLGSWQQDGSLFAADATTLAVEGDTLLGIEIGMPGPEYTARQQGLAPVWKAMLADGRLSEADLAGVLERSDHASWLNPVVHADTYYIHALSVTPAARGKRVGYQLIQRAIDAAREQGFARLQLDVLSDNPAVSFYHSVGLEILAETRAPKPAEFGVPPELRMGMHLL